MTYDTYYANLTPNWETPSVVDDPSLDLDDTDGAGPENINLNQPLAGRTYRVGVHYWADYGAGATGATVRIYIHGELVHEAKIQSLKDCDLWDVAEIEWPSGTVKPVSSANGSQLVHRICADQTEMYSY